VGPGTVIIRSKAVGLDFRAQRLRIWAPCLPTGMLCFSRLAKVRPASAVPRYALALMLPTLTAHTALNIGSVSSMLEVVPTGCRQGGIKRCQPLPIHLGDTPDLV